MRAAALCLALCVPAHGFVAQSPTPRRAARRECASPILCAEPTPEEITKKYGFEAGIFNALKSGGGGKDGEGGGMKTAGDLLKRYGGAYLLTSTSLALVSFGLCYVLVDNGVDVAGLLKRVGIEASSNTENIGTFSIAYVAHKAASPIRFPPTVALTPVVAKRLFGKTEEELDASSEEPDASSE
eukprot:CAMPEP_0118828218 /NCGR_PEP_ID=MMETSP1162-20130426/17065_1 /TAXON_ID=33656 /ORGANISM="Phaeocystis Sp, Strain CCMP2710" /LENGTH=183 /DNA_ID=CAMNT_0006759167 /DNA_START=10 /DNA_END=561 /DNA_ORIENTATION=-